MHNKLTFLLTGSTGLLGRNLLMEIIKNNRDNLENIEIIILGRSSKILSLHDRTMAMLEGELLDYIGDAKINQNKQNLLNGISESLTCVEAALDKLNLGISPDNIKLLSSKQIDFFFHIAALTDFRSGDAVQKVLDKINVFGTEQVLNLLPKLTVKEFCYISSAYVCGMTTGNIMPDYVNIDQEFRNYYEKTKLKAEIMVRNFCNNQNIKFRIFRPSTISGRLMENPIGSLSKIDVFYEWCSFFYRYKKKQLGKESCINEPLSVDLRFHYSQESGLNIVPADYIGKIIYTVCINNHKEQSFHVVNNAETPHKLYTDIMLESINVSGVKYAKDVPVDKNRLETLYYKTVGSIYTPYITMKPMLFNVDNLQDVFDNTRIICPIVDEKNFKALMNFVVERNFIL